ncbi:hypothetical protein [Thalassolituus marinus]|uniref:Porin n=1 Tax=Thalassolituus marinus TaxID=671053 RepID=A0ABS7ZSV2_9GAMM|nr:hypothetical protein [Thalassolituus marinus]MCA6063466.1 hypothetical protein [Thalassolituus marinus]
MTDKYLILIVLATGLVGYTNVAQAELTSLSDEALGEVKGEGIGFMLEDFAFEAGADVATGNRLDITGLTNSAGDDVVLSVSQFYIAGSGSNLGTNVIGNPVNLGRLLYPYNLELLDGDDIGIAGKAVFEFATPQRFAGNSTEKPYSLLDFNMEQRTESRYPGEQTATGRRVDSVSGVDLAALSSRASERADFGIRYDLMENGVRAQSLEAHAQGVATDGSFLRLWGDNNEMVGNLEFNFYAQDLLFFACDANGNNCGDSVQFHNFVLESQLGYGEEQPVTFEVESDGNFTIEVGSIEGKTNAFYQDFYANGPRTDIYIENVSVGGSDFGSATVSNLQIQYLRATSRDL